MPRGMHELSNDVRRGCLLIPRTAHRINRPSSGGREARALEHDVRPHLNPPYSPAYQHDELRQSALTERARTACGRGHTAAALAPARAGISAHWSLPDHPRNVVRGARCWSDEAPCVVWRAGALSAARAGAAGDVEQRRPRRHRRDPRARDHVRRRHGASSLKHRAHRTTLRE